MNQLNPELQSQVELLAAYCGKCLDGKEMDFIEDTRPIIESLVLGGYQHWSDTPLANRVEEIAVDRFEDLAIHRRAQLRSYTEQLQDAFEERKRWYSQNPKDFESSKAANISSATDS